MTPAPGGWPEIEAAIRERVRKQERRALVFLLLLASVAGAAIGLAIRALRLAFGGAL